MHSRLRWFAPMMPAFICFGPFFIAMFDGLWARLAGAVMVSAALMFLFVAAAPKRAPAGPEAAAAA